jgi:hypothetical protein
MKVFLTKSLLLISLVICLQSCNTPKHLLPLKDGQNTTLSEQNFKAPFQDNFKSMVFKTNLTYGEKLDFGGLLALKQMKAGNYRAIFMTMSGSTLFDFEFGEQGFVVHKLLKSMNKKLLLKIIEQDFFMLLANNIPGKKGIVFRKEKQTIIKTKINNKIHYFLQQKNHLLTEVHQGKNVTLTLSEFQKSMPGSINIQHHNFPLNMHLKLIKK